MPLLHVLLQQHQRIVAMSTKYTLDPRELGSAWASITQILQVLNARVLYLLDCVQPRLVNDLFGEFACGMFATWPWSSFPTPVLKEAEPELPPPTPTKEDGRESQRSSSEVTADVLRFPSGAVLTNTNQPFQPNSILKPPNTSGGPHAHDHDGSSSSESRSHLEGSAGEDHHKKSGGIGALFKGLFGPRKRDPNKEYVEEMSRQLNPDATAEGEEQPEHQ